MVPGEVGEQTAGAVEVLARQTIGAGAAVVPLNPSVVVGGDHPARVVAAVPVFVADEGRSPAH